MMKLSRELAAVSNQIRGLIAGEAHCLAMPAPGYAGNQIGNDSKGVSHLPRLLRKAALR
jgi:hypothetical protein